MQNMSEDEKNQYVLRVTITQYSLNKGLKKFIPKPHDELQQH